MISLLLMCTHLHTCAHTQHMPFLQWTSAWPPAPPSQSSVFPERLPPDLPRGGAWGHISSLWLVCFAGRQLVTCWTRGRPDTPGCTVRAGPCQAQLSRRCGHCLLPGERCPARVTPQSECVSSVSRGRSPGRVSPRLWDCADPVFLLFGAEVGPCPSPCSGLSRLRSRITCGRT